MEEKNQGIYINGKEQVIELMNNLTHDERRILLGNIRLKNPALAKELAEHSFNFDSISNLSEEMIRRVFTSLNPAITGLSLYLSSKSYQRKILSILPREYSIKAFEILQKDLSGNISQCKKAQSKVVETAKVMSRRSGKNLF